jgi:hypothetical protein
MTSFGSKFARQVLLVLGLLFFLSAEGRRHPFVQPRHTAVVPRGGAESSPKKSLKDKIQPAIDGYIANTFYSEASIPKSPGDAEWLGFINGWLLVTLPIPLPLLLSALVLNTLILLLSKWNATIKNKYLIGLYHGVTVVSVMLRELELLDKGQPRIALMGANLGASLFLGQAGGYILTKRFMDLLTFGTLFYILVNYFT